MSDVHNDDVKNLLDKNKIQHTEAVMYRTVSNDFAADEAFDYDMLVFFSPAGISALKKKFPLILTRRKSRSEHSALPLPRQSVMPGFVLTWKLPACRHPQ